MADIRIDQLKDMVDRLGKIGVTASEAAVSLDDVSKAVSFAVSQEMRRVIRNALHYTADHAWDRL